MKRNPIIVALDVPPAEALGLVEKLNGLVGGVKVGSESFTAAGPGVIQFIHAEGLPVFLDLKWHDIPNTVAKAVSSATRLGVRMMNVHASGGIAMMQAAKQAAVATSKEMGVPAPLVLGVTILTSLDYQALMEIGMAPNITGSDEAAIVAERTQWMKNRVVNLALAAQRAGLDGLVCSGKEVKEVRASVQETFQLVVPGVRLPGADTHDQKRVVTPRQAMDDGADWVVIGRQIYEADDPRAAAEEILATLE